MNTFRHAFFGALSVIAFCVLAAGCTTSSSSGSAKSTNSPSATVSASPSLPAGPQLGKALVPLSALPSGFKDNPSGDRNTGQELPDDTPSPIAASKVCDTLGSTGWIEDGGIENNAFAETDYVNADHTAEIGEEADTFTGDDATTVMNTLWQDLGKCAKFTEHADSNKASVTITRKKLSGAGGEGIEGVELSPTYEGGTTIAAVRVGNVIVTTIDSSPKSDNGSPAVTYARTIAANVGKI